MIGYCCINKTLGKQVCVGRTLRKKTFQTSGLMLAGEKTLANVQDMVKILQWNLEHDILLYRKPAI